MTERLPLVHRILGRAGALLLDRVAMPLAVVRPLMLLENAVENRRGGWERLRDEGEAARYAVVREVVERYARDGLVLDLGCSQAILAEGLTCRRYVGVDRSGPALRRARVRDRPGTELVEADAASYVPDEAPDVVVLNEVLYYLPHPVTVARRHARGLAPGGVLVVCCYARTWPTRHLLVRLRRRLEQLELHDVVAGRHAWEVAVLRPHPDLSGQPA